MNAQNLLKMNIRLYLSIILEHMFIRIYNYRNKAIKSNLLKLLNCETNYTFACIIYLVLLFHLVYKVSV